ncbi:MAG: LCP family protein [Clostridiales bacterium]|nr:LCP family protein [Clostridiales bacterium]
MKERNSKQEMSQKAVRRAKRRKKRVVLLGLEIVLLIILAAGVYVLLKYEKLGTENIQNENIIINENVNETMKEYTNIALFGIDSRDESLDSGNRSDTMMIASINNKTKEVRLVSVYRDTYLLIPKEGADYNKANLAYFYGGQEGAINLFNMNLDLDITDFVSVNFTALIDTIDLLGGIDLEITEIEREYINGYMTETSKITGKKITPLNKSGMVHLDGLQATAYCRIRQTKGDDYRRTERQRLVISLIAEKSKKADIFTLNKIIDEVFPNISTSLDMAELFDLAKDVAKYELTETAGFPFEKQGKDLGKKGSCVIPVDLEKNVIALHKFLFATEAYTASSTVITISDTIKTETGIK